MVLTQLVKYFISSITSKQLSSFDHAYNISIVSHVTLFPYLAICIQRGSYIGVSYNARIEFPRYITKDLVLYINDSMPGYIMQLSDMHTKLTQCKVLDFSAIYIYI